MSDLNTSTQQQVNEPTEPTSIMSGGWTSFVPLILIFVVFYFFLIRPQEKKRKAQQSLVSSAKKGEKVLTNSGLYGTIAKINDSEGTIDLEIAPDVTVKLLKTSIADIVDRKEKEKK